MATQIISTDSPLEAPLPREILSQLYSTMLKARLLSKRWRNAPRMSEAVLSGTLANAESPDLLVSAGPHPILAALNGTPIAEVASKNPNARVIAAGDDAAAGIACGVGLALQNAKANAMIIALLPAEVTRGPAWDQATEFAALNRLPILFVSDGTESRSSRKHDGRDLSHWPFPTIAVDGRDVIAVYRVTKEAISAARRGHGPTLVDCVNFVAPGTRGRDTRDPIASFRGYLKRHNAWSDEGYQQMEAELSRELSVK